MDALDECSDQDMKDLIKAIGALYNETPSNAETGARLRPRLLITSRPYGQIERHLTLAIDAPVSLIRLQGHQGDTTEAISKEIDIVLNSRITELAAKFNYPPDLEELLRGRLRFIENKTYLWITLVFDGLVDSGIANRKDVEKLIDQPPETVYEAYEKILGKRKDPERTMQLLRIVVGAFQPLSLQDVLLALCLHNNEPDTGESPAVVEETIME
jgi:hypothetical protein